MKRKVLFFILILFSALSVGFLFVSIFNKQSPGNSDNPSREKWKLVPPTVDYSLLPEAIIEPVANSETATTKTTPENPVDINQKIEQGVPFIVQAPLGNWDDWNFQNACEEASMIMAMGWVKGEKSISPDEAQKRILELIDFENKTLGYSIDTNAADMEKIFREYFRHDNAQAEENITIGDIKAELQKGRVVIIPVFGQALHNPFFTPPGPIAHMLVIIGYDPLKKDFITNEPGTRKGAGYRYDESALFDAIWEYPSGPDSPPSPTGARTKAMISVGK